MGSSGGSRSASGAFTSAHAMNSRKQGSQIGGLVARFGDVLGGAQRSRASAAASSSLRPS